MTEPRQAYALARLGARHGALRRPGERAALSASRSPDRYLEVLRQARLLTPPESVTARDVDAFELFLAAAWRAACEEVAGWHPREWRAAYRWCGALADLAVLEQLGRGGAATGWAMHDARLAPVAAAPPAQRAALLAAVGLGPLAAAFAEATPLSGAWRAHWHALWPRVPRATARQLAALEALCTDAGIAAAAAGERRVALAAGFERLYRRSRGTAAAGFCALGERALDLEAWRGGFAARLYAPAAERAGARS